MKIALRVVVFVFVLALARPGLAAGFEEPIPSPYPAPTNPGVLLAG